MRLDRKGIPAFILYGEGPRRFRSVHTVYKANLIREVMVRANAAFWKKAKGGTDDLGNKWKPLAASTHAYKPYSPRELNTYKINGRLTRGLLTPAQDKLWRAIYARTLSRLEKKGVADAEKKAAERAWGVLKARGARTKLGLNRITDINIRTGALVAATSPGTVANNRYYPPGKQRVIYRPRGAVTIAFMLPYIKKVDAVRPVIPDDISKWILEAHEIAIREASIVYERIQSASKNNSRNPKRKPANRNKIRRNRRTTRR